jgi:hypothetical protein
LEHAHFLGQRLSIQRPPLSKGAIAGAKTLDECKGKTINDYQQYLEENWVKDLKGEFKVEVNQDVFEKVNNVKLNYSIGPRRAGDIEQIYAQVDKSQQVMGWSAEKTLEDSLRDAWRWQQRLAEGNTKEAV